MPSELLLVAIAVSVTVILMLGGGAGLWKLLSRTRNHKDKTS